MSAQGGVCLGVSVQGVVCLGGCLPGDVYTRGCLPRGVSASSLKGCLKEEAVGVFMVLVSHHPLFDLPHSLNQKYKTINKKALSQRSVMWSPCGWGGGTGGQVTHSPIDVSATQGPITCLGSEDLQMNESGP